MMRLILTTIILTMLAQPVWANCDLTEEEGHCEVGEAGFVAFTTGTGRSLSEAYCNALGQLRPLGVASDLSSTLTEYDDGTKTDLMEELSEWNVCNLQIVARGIIEETIAEDGSIQKSTHKEKVTITRGMSLLTCGYHNEEDVNGGTFIEKFDERQNFYGDLIHPANPPKCGPDEKFEILKSKPMDDGSYWSVKVAHRVKADTN